MILQKYYYSALRHEMRREEMAIRFNILSNVVGFEIKNEREYELVRLGASQEVVNSGISVDAYRLVVLKGKK